MLMNGERLLMNLRRLGIRLAASALAFCTPAFAGGDNPDCTIPEISPFTAAPGWTYFYSGSIGPASLVHRTPPAHIPFDRMQVLEDAPSITIEAMIPKVSKTGQIFFVPENRTIDNPVLMVSWVHSTAARFTEFEDLCDTFNWQAIPKFGEYECNPNLDNRGGNIWFAKDGDLKSYLDEIVGLDRRCLNPAFSQNGCTDALLWGVAPLGLPFGFSPPIPSYDPYGDAIAAWWKQFLIVSIVDRDDVVRPSYNPSVAPATADRETRNGEPIWDVDLGRYRFADPNKKDEVGAFLAQQGAIEDFVGYIGGECGNPADTLRGPGGFYKWLSQWQANSWNGEAPYGVFPYSSVGFTLNWQLSPSGADPTFYSQSEFLLKGEQPAYVIGTWSGSQYLGERQPGQVGWWDSCPEDLNMDGAVNAADLGILMAAWGTPNPCSNFNSQTPMVDAGDLGRLLSAWGECPGWPQELIDAGLVPSDYEP